MQDAARQLLREYVEGREAASSNFQRFPQSLSIDSILILEESECMYIVFCVVPHKEGTISLNAAMFYTNAER